MRDQAATITRPEAENAALKIAHGEQVASVKRLEAENAALKKTIDEGLVMQLKNSRAAPERTPFHPEFLGFMRETFASEAMRTCNERMYSSFIASQRCKSCFFVERVAAEHAASDARVQIAALELKVARLEDAMDLELDSDLDAEAPAPAVEKPITDGQPEAAPRAWGRDDPLQTGTVLDNTSVYVPRTTIEGLEDRVKELETENETLRSDAVRDAASLRDAKTCISDQKSRIAALEVDVAHLTRITEEETDALRKLLAAREYSKGPK
ncbi:hypothetical protein B0H12DRAFT_760583 [Mycena haematopus]|nr:hypothetical protein B0H12DRAFT_760583 [Mycena haematopus]